MKLTFLCSFLLFHVVFRKAFGLFIECIIQFDCRLVYYLLCIIFILVYIYFYIMYLSDCTLFLILFSILFSINTHSPNVSTSKELTDLNNRSTVSDMQEP